MLPLPIHSMESRKPRIRLGKGLSVAGKPYLSRHMLYFIESPDLEEVVHVEYGEVQPLPLVVVVPSDPERSPNSSAAGSVSVDKKSKGKVKKTLGL